MLACPRCDGPLPETFYNFPALQPCPSCATPIRLEVFPAVLVSPETGRVGETLLVEGESSCFYHLAKRAGTACEVCGRFLCALCDLDLNGQHLCPGCLETGKRKGRLKQLENRRMRYDSLALTVALAPLLIFYLTIFTAPTTLYLVIRHWNGPRGIVGGGRWRLVAAFLVALAEIAGWIWVIHFFMHGGLLPTHTVKYQTTLPAQ